MKFLLDLFLNKFKGKVKYNSLRNDYAILIYRE